MKSFSGRIGSMYLLVAIIYLVLIVQGRSNPTGEKEKPVETVAQKRVHASGKQPNLEYAKPMEFDECAVAADNELCSKIGVEIFKKGGTAADAIVSTHCCVEIVNSHSTGLGGGGFMVYYDKKSGNATAYDFRETLPEAYSDSQNKTQGETILVPGVLRGLEAVWKDYGKLTWSELWQPCIKLAKEGFRIHEALGAGIVKKKDYIMANLGLRELYAPDGNILEIGSMLKRPKLARTYEKIAKYGAKVFYQGEMAEQIVNDVKEAGGIMTLEDLQKFQVARRRPLKTKINNYNILTTGSPSSGSFLALALKIMTHFNWTSNDLRNNADKVYHQMIEVMKMAYAPLTFLGDPRYTPHIKEVEEYMLNDETAKRMFERIDNNSHGVEYYQPYSRLMASEKTGTSHMSLLDPMGSAISVTTSINAYFGSKLRSRQLGFIYNNELADFAEFWPTIYNLTTDKKKPGKRPMSRSMPSIFLDKKGDVKAVFGAAGGFFIPSAISMTIANWLFFKDNLKVAITRPRLHCQLFPPTVVYEPTLPPELIPKLENFDHRYVTNSTYDVSGQLAAIMGVVQAIARTDPRVDANGKTIKSKIAAECDYRKGGKPDGY